MCDTYVALAPATKDGTVIFGKNSDRYLTEPQIITYTPRTKYDTDLDLKCTHISIPQVKETAAVLLSQPYWIWGAEMGANEYGVVIGNEAVMTKEPLEESGLIGMDFLRLGLERGKTAKNALKVITDILEKYGQGGIHNQGGGNYHNSFIISDPEEAFILETAGNWWVVEKVKDIRSISNDLTIKGKGDMRREGIIDYAINKEYCNDENDFDFSITFASERPFPSYIECSMGQLRTEQGEITPKLMANFLKEHEGNICRHKRKDLTAGAQISHLRKGKKSIHWFTGSMLTCLSIFKPYAFPIEGQRVKEPGPYSEIDSEWYWNRHQNYVKPYMRNPTKENPARELVQSSIELTERQLFERISDLYHLDNSLDDFTEEEFINKITFINDLAWKESEDLIL